ncbi:sensor histidine kinase [Rouxiella badensis]|uniref:sensor histidine kinase n=1 Tax=Rouxiella badensis TaxID=1646377 RepID=UPI0017885FBC|nr:ATP-binding protein [Rouxiella badensis]QOI55672.1 two-component sensor histidine kinase [Rouxiella badensis subsp. acadiensis]
MNSRHQSLWRWICVRILLLAIGSVCLIALCMWSRFALVELLRVHEMPSSVSAEFKILLLNPEINPQRFHQIVDKWWGIRFSDPSIASADWITVGILVVVTIPFIVFFGLRSALPLSLQFSRLASSAREVARGDFETQAALVKGAPSELVQFTEDFNTMVQQLSRYERELHASHVAMAHELRSPLTAAMGRLQGMIDGVFQPEPRQLEMVMKQLVSLNRLIDELHLLSLADAGELSLDIFEWDLAELLQERVMWIKPQAETTGMIIAVHAPAKCRFKGDPFRLGQVFTILMENALRYASEGGTLDIYVERLTDAYQISFCDKGKGVSEAFIPLMFERFTRAETSRARHFGGSGLGLSIARAICESHGGRIMAQNAENGGLKVVIQFPDKEK